MMTKFIGCDILLIIFWKILTAGEIVAGETLALNSTLYEIVKDDKQLENDYRDSLLEIANNYSGNYKINLILSSGDCSACDEVLSLLMKALTHTFLTVNYLKFATERIVEENATLVPHIGYYKFVSFLLKNDSEFHGQFAKLREEFAWNPRAQHLIFLVEKPSDDVVEMIFEECWSHRVLNVAVIVLNRKKAYTYNPYLKKPPKIWENMTNWSRLFYDKLGNMNGRSIRAKFIPFTNNGVLKWIEEEGRYKILGEEFGFAEAFFKSVNATPVFLNLTNDKILLFKDFPYRYEIWTDRKFRGFELWMNVMPAKIKFQARSERSYPVARGDLHILAPKSGVKIPSIFEPYDTVTWLTVLVSLITFALYSHFFNKSRRIVDNAFLRTFGVFLGKNLANRNHEPIEKGVFLILTMYSLMILSAYQGALYGALTTVTNYPDIETIFELSKVTKTIRTFQNLAEYLEGDMQHGIKVVPFEKTDLIEYMRTHRGYAYAFPTARVTYTAKSKILSENGVPFYHVMEGYTMPEFTTHVFPYGSPYVEKVERVVLACKETGLQQYWETLANLEALLSGTIILYNAGERKLKKLSLQTQLMAFYIWAAGLFASFCCFIAEIYLSKEINKEKKIEIIE